jgi:CDP-2,3-bis-(O-geranylgeranyl)-sn-glycerol synthase
VLGFAERYGSRRRKNLSLISTSQAYHCASWFVSSLWPSVQDWVFAIYILVPIYCTNGAPVVFGGGRPIDSGRLFSDGKRIFGDNKTVRGFVSGVTIGAIVGIFESALLSQKLLPIAILASLGALLGDLAGAFVKRRLSIKPGGPLPIVDQLDFVLGAVLLTSIVTNVSLGTALIVFLVTPPVHLMTNLGAYALGLKSTYW